MSTLEIAAATEAKTPGSPGASSRRLGLAGWLLPIALAVLWELLVRAGIANGRLMPPPSVVGRTLWGLAVSGVPDSNI